MTFISVLRLLPNWFSGRRLPIVSQWVGNTRPAGPDPLRGPVRRSCSAPSRGRPTFLILCRRVGARRSSAFSLFVDNGIRRSSARCPRPDLASALRRCVASGCSRPAGNADSASGPTSSTQSSGTVFALLWGLPVPLRPRSVIDHRTRRSLLTLMVVTAIVVGPILGLLDRALPAPPQQHRARHRLRDGDRLGDRARSGPGTRRSGASSCWSWRSAIGGPGSLIGFDFARTFNPLRSLGSRERHRERRRIPRELRDDVPHRHPARHRRATRGRRLGSDSLLARRIPVRVPRCQYLVVGIGVVFLFTPAAGPGAGCTSNEGIEVAPLWVALMRAWRRRRQRQAQ